MKKKEHVFPVFLFTYNSVSIGHFKTGVFFVTPYKKGRFTIGISKKITKCTVSDAKKRDCQSQQL